MLGHEIGMLAEPITRSFDLDDDGVVEEAIEQRGGDNGIAEDLSPFGEAAVGGEDHGAALVAGIDQLEEQVAAAGNDREVSDLIDDQERGPAQEANALAQLAFSLGLGERTETASAGYVEHNRRWVAQAGALDEAYGHSPADIGSAPARGAKVE